jgi:hypothetical protein
VGLHEARELDRLYAEVRGAGPMPDIPLIILSSTTTDAFRDAVSFGESPDLMQAELAGKAQLYEDFANAVSSGEVRPVDTGHVTMAFRHPEAVLEAVWSIAGSSCSNDAESEAAP